MHVIHNGIASSTNKINIQNKVVNNGTTQQGFLIEAVAHNSIEIETYQVNKNNYE